MKKAPMALKATGGGIRISNLYIAILCAVNLVAGAILLSPSASAENATDSVAVSVPVSCTLGGNSLNTYNVSLVSGHLISGIGGTTIKAYCNDSNGYVIYAVGYSGDKDGGTDLINSNNTNYNIHTGTSTGGTTSSWAMKITAGTGSGADGYSVTPPTIKPEYTSYHEIPSSYDIVAWRTSAADLAEDVTKTGSFITAEYQVYANTMQPSGTYVGQVKYAMLHPYTSSNPRNLGQVLDDAAKAGEISKVTVGANSYYAMQDLTPALCGAANVLGEASQVQMVDKRDGKTYWVTKLEDGHCWMTQNLDLSLESDTSSSGYVALTSENTDLNQYGSNNYTSANGYTCSNADSSTCQGSGEVITWLPERSTIATGNLSTTTWVNSQTDPYSYDPGADNAVDATMNAAGAGAHALTGNYYNWSAAIASNDSSNFATSTMDNVANNPQNSICPKGWRLPTISNDSGESQGSTNEFRRLNIIYNSNQTGSGAYATWLMAPTYFPRGGYVHSGTVRAAGSNGYWWSSTVYSATGARYLNLYPGAIYPENYAYRLNGFSLRCLLR